jgi:hypothetical protein
VLRAGPSRVAIDVANADGGLADEIDAARAEAVEGLRAYGYSWAEIGSRSASSARPLSNAGDNVASPAVPHDTTGGKSRPSPLSLDLWV